MYTYFKKSVCLTLLLSIIIPSSFFSLSPKAYGQWLVEDAYVGVQTTLIGVNTSLSASFDAIETDKETFLDPLAYYAARFLIRMLTQSIVDWINSGFNGNPSFVEDPKDFLLATADRTIGEFIFDSDLGFLCKPFEINVRLALGLQYNPFQDKIRCTLSQILQNADGTVTDTYDKFMNGDFIEGGGWDTWLQVTTVPQNNQLGAMLIAQAELDARLESENKRVDQELSWGAGVLSQKQCEETVYDASGNVVGTPETYSGDARFSSNEAPAGTVTSGPTRQARDAGTGLAQTSSSTYNVVSNNTFRVTENADGTGATLGNVKQVCKIVTPGSMLNDLIQSGTKSDLSQLQLADEFNEIVGALANFAITKIMEPGGLLGRRERDVAADDTAWKQGIAELTQQSNANYSDIASQASSINDRGAAIGGNVNRVANANITPGLPGVSDDPFGSGGFGGLSVDQAKAILSTYASQYLTTEQAYNTNYKVIYNAASTTASTISSTIACYNIKLASGTLTTAQRATASTIIASSTAKLNSYRQIASALITTNINPSNSSLANLQSVVAAINSATTIDALTQARNTLSSLLPNVNQWDTAAVAIATPIFNGINADLTTATAQRNACSTFPN